MITTTQTFSDNAKSIVRKPQTKIEFDWDDDGIFTLEANRSIVVEVERKLNEPLGGVSIAQADVQLINTDDRYTSY